MNRKRLLVLTALLSASALGVAIATPFPKAFFLGSGGQITPRSATPSKTAGNGAIWINSGDSNKLYYTDPSNTSAAVGSGGGGSTGNYSFATNAMDLSGAAAMSIAPTNATTIILGKSTSLAANQSLAFNSGTGGVDFSAGSGVFKTTTGAHTFAGSSYSFNAALTSAIKGWSLVDLCVSGNISGCTIGSVDATVGVKMYWTQPVSVTGIRFWWGGGTSPTVTAKLYTGGSAVKSCTVAVSSAGAYSCNFSSAATIAGANLATVYYVAIYPGNSKYPYTSDTSYGHPVSSVPTTRAQVGLFQQYLDNSIYAAGDAQPDTSGGSGQYFPVEPLFTAP